MIHTTTESDATSMAPSSASPMAAYYVQSPSQDSPDETDKCSSSNSRSPSRSPCSYPRHSMASSSSTAASRVLGNRRRWNKHYCNVVTEEEAGGYEVDDYDGDVGLYCRVRKCLILVLVFGILFSGTCLAFWVASRHYESQVSIKSLWVQNLSVGEGSDETGVPTRLVSVNCSASLAIYNPATFFGIHVVLRTASLVYSQITVATGQLKKCYIPKKSKMILWVRLIGHEVPLYGAEMASNSNEEIHGGTPFKLEFEIQSRGFLIGNLVNTTKHTIHASCSVLVNPKHTNEIRLGPRSCKYV